jgi:hypothetical protein
MVLTLCGCDSWTTRYSGKYDSRNQIVVNLYEDGRPMIGICGICRTITDSYTFQLSPIKREYRNGEIGLVQHTEGSGDIANVKSLPLAVMGFVSFDDRYSHVTIAISVKRNGRDVSFAGNGTYVIRSGD